MYMSICVFECVPITSIPQTLEYVSRKMVNFVYDCGICGIEYYVKVTLLFYTQL